MLQIARSLIEHPQHAERIAFDEVTALVSAPELVSLLHALVEASRGSGRIDVEHVAESLSEGSRNLLRSLAASDEMDETTAARTIDDTLAWLRRRRKKEAGRALTDRLRDPNSDWRELLAEKDRNLGI